MWAGASGLWTALASIFGHALGANPKCPNQDAQHDDIVDQYRADEHAIRPAGPMSHRKRYRHGGRPPEKSPQTELQPARRENFAHHVIIVAKLALLRAMRPFLLHMAKRDTIDAWQASLPCTCCRCPIFAEPLRKPVGCLITDSGRVYSQPLAAGSHNPGSRLPPFIMRALEKRVATALRWSVCLFLLRVSWTFDHVGVGRQTRQAARVDTRLR
jgi:hypothetical protein